MAGGRWRPFARARPVAPAPPCAASLSRRNYAHGVRFLHAFFISRGAWWRRMLRWHMDVTMMGSRRDLPRGGISTIA
ncbi:hypothetical protein [Novacetimonas cocois]|uniref:hypothetical protein n=1 Tax=Novacetimonas cocois TaxID=1747507 RepID=UPI001057998F|nr:hypothetical protein [Novacetimonas cocois]